MANQPREMCDSIAEMPPFMFMDRPMLKRLCRNMEVEQYAVG